MTLQSFESGALGAAEQTWATVQVDVTTSAARLTHVDEAVWAHSRKDFDYVAVLGGQEELRRRLLC